MKAIVTEKAVLMIERDNTLVFEDSKNKMKEEIKKSNSLNVTDLAKGGLGRLVIFSEEAIKELEERIK